MGFEGILSGPDFPEAQCKGTYDKFFPEAKSPEVLHKQLAECKAICDSCIHKKECYDYALTIPLNWGFWGGVFIGSQANPINTNQGIR